MRLAMLHIVLTRAAIIGLILLLAACASAPVPDMAFYRMPSVPDTARDPTQETRFPIPMAVAAFRADGVYNDQAILYALNPEGSIKAYHYQLWDEPPSLIFQRRLIDRLREEHTAPLIADRLPPGLDTLRVFGRVQRFERVRIGKDWVARVRFELRLERRIQDPPLLLQEYGADVIAENDSIQATIRAFAQALDQGFAAFDSDLAQLEIAKAP